MSDSRGKLPDGGQLVGLKDLLLHRFSVGNVLYEEMVNFRVPVWTVSSRLPLMSPLKQVLSARFIEISASATYPGFWRVCFKAAPIAQRFERILEQTLSRRNIPAGKAEHLHA